MTKMLCGWFRSRQACDAFLETPSRITSDIRPHCGGVLLAYTDSAKPNDDALVACIRAHPKVGVGSCSVIDECYTDDELARALREASANTFTKARREALWRHRLHREREREAKGAAW